MLFRVIYDKLCMNAIFYEHKNTNEVFQCYYCHWSLNHDNCQFFMHTKNNEATQFGDQNLFYIVAFTLNPAEQITHLTHTHTHTPSNQEYQKWY